MRTANCQALTRTRQHGAALLVMLLIMIIGAAYLVVSQLNRASGRIEADRKTTEALAMAKEALIGRAASDATRPGELPCPDVDNDGRLRNGIDFGRPGFPRGCTSFIGRLPWRTLGLPDLRDGNGERLWYALSMDFRAGDPVPLNSDTNGQITVRSSSGIIINDGTNASAAIAVVFAPGSVLTRQGAPLAQDRTCTVGVNCTADDICTSVPTTLTPKCNPVNYLDLFGTEDNADDFVAGSVANGFIAGEIRDPADLSNVLVNDRISVISHDDLFKVVERRVANEVRKVLTNYFTLCGNYPVPALFTNPVPAASFNSVAGKTEGLFPTGVALPTPWGGACGPGLPAWITNYNWHHVMYYTIATLPCAVCLTVINGSNPGNNKQAVIIMTGRAIVNSHPGPLADYLEAQNLSTGDTIFQAGSLSPIFNDLVVTIPP